MKRQQNTHPLNALQAALHFGQRGPVAAARATVARQPAGDVCAEPSLVGQAGLRYSGKQFGTLDNSDPNGFTTPVSAVSWWPTFVCNTESTNNGS